MLFFVDGKESPYIQHVSGRCTAKGGAGSTARLCRRKAGKCYTAIYEKGEYSRKLLNN